MNTTATPITLSKASRTRLMRRIWTLWVLRRALPLGILAAIVIVEGLFVSYVQILNAAWESRQSFDGFVQYWVSAFSHTEPVVIIGLLTMIACAAFFLKDIGSVFRRNHLSMERSFK